MIYPENFEQKIGFDTIRGLLAKKCISNLGRYHIEQMEFSSDFDSIKQQLEETEEFCEIIASERSFPSQDYFDLRPELDRISVEGSCVELESLFNLKTSLSIIEEIRQYFIKAEEGLFHCLTSISENIIIDSQLIKSINTIIDAKGRIKDGASPNLKKIRKELIDKQSQIDKKINQALRSAKSAGITSDDIEVTIRNGRMVIPVLAHNKRKLKGFIHDESATGKTVYIEPTEVFDANNEIRDLENAEKREIIKILIAITTLIRPHIDELSEAYNILGIFDFIGAKAKLANEIRAIKPDIENKTMIHWENAIHPLLFLTLKNKDKIIVPLTIDLNAKKRILIISGPNAGGKSVCLKTVGLLQYMLQCGMLIPMSETSKVGIFKDIFIDIGDDQSLENDLSTYSSHLKHIKFFIKNTGNETLILIDEFGTGTEPQIGGAIAEAAIEELNKKHAFSIITTHYANLKLLADHEEGVVNGAMLFDSRKMQPLYQLKTGKPGSSFAFEIARKIGISKEVLENAEKKSGKSQLDFDKQLQQLEVEKENVKKQQAKFRVADEFLSEMIEKYDSLNNELEERKNKILEHAKKEAIDLIDSSNRLIERTIREIKENLAEKEKTKSARKDLTKHKEKISEKKLPERKPPAVAIDKKEEAMPGVPGVGDHVRLKDHETTGEIVKIKGGNAEIFTGSVKLTLPLNKLIKTKSQKISSGSLNKSYRNIVNDLNKKLEQFNLTLDLRGKRADEALADATRYIDDAIILSIKEVRIIHGKGDGILRSVIRDFLNSIDEIQQYSDENLERGGSGITVIRFR